MRIRSRYMMFAPIIAVLLVSISATSVLAVGPIHGHIPDSNNRNLESRWKNERATLQRYQLLGNQIAKWISEWLRTPRSLHKRAKKNGYANDVYLALQQAEVLAANHPGFDAKGNVINKTQAAQSVQQLAIYLREMHTVFRHKFHH